MTAAANAYVRYPAFYAFPAPGPPAPRRGPPGLGILRSLVHAATALFPSLHAQRGTVLADPFPVQAPAAPTRGARQVPERTEV